MFCADGDRLKKGMDDGVILRTVDGRLTGV